jgi:glycosyltransferase involved in cell wall biosynthesis
VTPTVSVCIPVYNGGAFIDETIRSVLAQTYEDFELVVVDDVSTDDSLERLERHAAADPRVRVVAADEHVSAVENFRRATALCTGRYLKLLCHDDTLATACLAQQVAALEANPSAAIVASRRAIVDETGRVLLRRHGLSRMRGLIPGGKAIAECIRGGTNLIGEPSAVLVRAETLERTGSWSDTWPYVTDLELWFRLLNDGDLVALADTLATFRVHTTGWSATMGHTQAEQVKRLFRREFERPGGAVRRRDVVIGSLKAQLFQHARRGLYLWRNLAGRRRVAVDDRELTPVGHG